MQASAHGSARHPSSSCSRRSVPDDMTGESGEQWWRARLPVRTGFYRVPGIDGTHDRRFGLTGFGERKWQRRGRQRAGRDAQRTMLTMGWRIAGAAADVAGACCRHAADFVEWRGDANGATQRRHDELQDERAQQHPRQLEPACGAGWARVSAHGFSDAAGIPPAADRAPPPASSHHACPGLRRESATSRSRHARKVASP